MCVRGSVKSIYHNKRKYWNLLSFLTPIYKNAKKWRRFGWLHPSPPWLPPLRRGAKGRGGWGAGGGAENTENVHTFSIILLFDQIRTNNKRERVGSLVVFIIRLLFHTPPLPGSSIRTCCTIVTAVSAQRGIGFFKTDDDVTEEKDEISRGIQNAEGVYLEILNGWIGTVVVQSLVFAIIAAVSKRKKNMSFHFVKVMSWRYI